MASEPATVLDSTAKPAQSERWLLLIHQLPAKPAYLRVKVWRRLQAIGAVASRTRSCPAGIGAEPRGFRMAAQGDLRKRRRSDHLRGALIDGLCDADVRALFNAQRDSEFAEIADEARILSAKLRGNASSDSRAELKAQLVRLKKRHAQTVAVDFFDANSRISADGLIAALETDLSEDPGRSVKESATKSETLNLTGRVGSRA